MWSVHASKHTSIHTHARNEVTLVWGSLRLAPISSFLLCREGVLWLVGSSYRLFDGDGDADFSDQ